MNSFELSPGAIATLACMLEVSAPKPGNVHRGADFEDVTFNDFAISAVVLGEVIESCVDQSFGQTVLAAVEQTNHLVGTNTNLGMILLIVPLAKIAASNQASTITTQSVSDYLAAVERSDGSRVFEAIRVASPGGLGDAAELDVMDTDSESIELMKAMRLATHRDAIAREYVTGFETVLGSNINMILRGQEMFGRLAEGIVFAHVSLMADRPDSLIARKCGTETAQHSQMLASKAAECLTSVGVKPTLAQKESFWNAVGELDFWLRSDGHRRNPGTTADLIAASLFAAIYNGSLKAPFR